MEDLVPRIILVVIAIVILSIDAYYKQKNNK